VSRNRAFGFHPRNPPIDGQGWPREGWRGRPPIGDVKAPALSLRFVKVEGRGSAAAAEPRYNFHRGCRIPALAERSAELYRLRRWRVRFSSSDVAVLTLLSIVAVWRRREQGGGGHAGSKRESCIRVHPLDREESAPETRKVISRV